MERCGERHAVQAVQPGRWAERAGVRAWAGVPSPGAPQSRAASCAPRVMAATSSCSRACARARESRRRRASHRLDAHRYHTPPHGAASHRGVADAAVDGQERARPHREGVGRLCAQREPRGGGSDSDARAAEDGSRKGGREKGSSARAGLSAAGDGPEGCGAGGPRTGGHGVLDDVARRRGGVGGEAACGSEESVSGVIDRGSTPRSAPRSTAPRSTACPPPHVRLYTRSLSHTRAAPPPHARRAVGSPREEGRHADGHTPPPEGVGGGSRSRRRAPPRRSGTVWRCAPSRRRAARRPSA